MAGEKEPGGRGGGNPESRGERREGVAPTNHIEAFLKGQGRGTSRYKAAADFVKLKDLEASIPGDTESDLKLRRIITGPIRETMRWRKTEKDGALYEEKFELFGRTVYKVYKSEERTKMSGALDSEIETAVAHRMTVDWKEAKRAVDQLEPTSNKNLDSVENVGFGGLPIPREPARRKRWGRSRR